MEELKNDEMVEIPKKQLSSILERLAAIEKGGAALAPKRVTERTAMLRLVDGKPIINWGKIYDKKDPLDGKKVTWAEIYLEGVKEPKTVIYLDFLNEPNQHKVNILKQTAKPIREILGYKSPSNPDPVHNKNFQAADSVEDVIERVEYECEVEVIDGEYAGKKFLVPNTSLNI